MDKENGFIRVIRERSLLKPVKKQYVEVCNDLERLKQNFKSLQILDEQKPGNLFFSILKNKKRDLEDGIPDPKPHPLVHVFKKGFSFFHFLFKICLLALLTTVNKIK